MPRRVALALLVVAGSAVVVGAGMLVASRWSGNVACDLAGSREASDALGRRVEAKRSPIAGFFESCDYYPPASRLPIGDLDVYTEDARATYESDRASYEAERPPLVLRGEDVGVGVLGHLAPIGPRGRVLRGFGLRLRAGWGPLPEGLHLRGPVRRRRGHQGGGRPAGAGGG